MKDMTQKSRSQSGSAIFIVLVGIALFAALSFVVAQSLRVSGNQSTNADQEKLELQMTELSQFFEAVRVKVNTMIQVDGVYDLTLSFKNDVYKNGMGVDLCQNDNASCTEKSCMVFSPENPHGIVPAKFDRLASPADLNAKAEPANGAITVAQLAIEEVGSSAQDLVLILHGVSPALCAHYNEKLGISIAVPLEDTTTMGDIGESSAGSSPANWGGCGDKAAFDSTNVFGDESKSFIGRKTFCAPLRTAGVVPTLGILYVLRAY